MKGHVAMLPWMIGIGFILLATIVAVVWAEAQLLRQKERDHPPSGEE